MYCIIGADLVPTERNITYFNKGDTLTLLGRPLKDYIERSVYRIYNLEVPITDQPAPIIKCGPTLIAPTSTIAGYSALRADCLSLANNHILDQGVSGLHSTIGLLKQSGIRYVGAGDCVDSARKPVYFAFSSHRVGIYACTHNEFSSATEESPGANVYDPLRVFEDIEAAKENCDFLIVLYHGGAEEYRYPSTQLQQICHKYVEKGANLVVCQHSHCIGCKESYKGGTIVYGQGNFLFDRKDNEYWDSGLLIQLEEDFSITYIPIVKNGFAVRLAEKNEKLEILRAFEERSEQIQEIGFVRDHFIAYAKAQVDGYLGMMGGKESFFFRGLNKLAGNKLRQWKVKYKYHQAQRVLIKNYFDCEAHREIISTGLEVNR